MSHSQNNDPFINDPFALGLNFSQKFSRQMIKPILAIANAIFRHEEDVHPFTELVAYEIRGRYQDAIGEKLYNELIRSSQRERHTVGRDIVFRMQVRNHLEVIEIFPNIPRVPTQPPCDERVYALAMEARRQASEIVGGDPNTMNVRYEFFAYRRDVIRAYILATRQRYIVPASHICVLREVQVYNRFAGTLLFTVCEEVPKNRIHSQIFRTAPKSQALPVLGLKGLTVRGRMKE